MELSEALLQGLKSGKEQAYKRLFCTYFVDLVMYAHSIVKNRELAEDLVQELFVDFWYERKYTHITSKLDSYLYRSVKNSCLNHLRDEKRRAERLIAMEPEEAEEAKLFSDERDEKEAIYQAVQQLPGQCKLIFTLCCLEGSTYQQVADRLGVSINTVRTQMGRAFKSLRNSLNKEDFSTILFFFKIKSLLMSGL